MNRKIRRELIKNKNLLNELYRIIVKYFPKLFDMFEDLTDVRHQLYVTYNMKTICITRLFSLLSGIQTMTDISSDIFNTESSIKNIAKISGQKLKEIPYWETIQDVFVNININELRNILKYIVQTLIRSKMFDKYRHNGSFLIVFDRTGLSCHNYNLNGNCLTRKHKSGQITYHRYVLECKLIVGNIVISLDSEFVENDKLLTENDKQDCETKAFKRLAKRIKENYPKQKFIIAGDALYATTPIINICKQNNWDYIFNLKEDRLKEVNDSFEGNITCHNEVEIKNYYLSTNIEFNGNKLNVLKFIENKKNKDTTYKYITNLNVSNNNIKDIVSLGRQRWKIENEGFHVQKHRTFDITRLNSRNENALKVHYFFIQIAHIIRQLLEKGSLLIKSLKMKLKEVSHFILKALTSSTTNLDLKLNFQLRFDT